MSSNNATSTSNSECLKYAVLWHADISEPHYDLLFETGLTSDLTAFRSSVWPIEHPTPLQRLKDHRRLYLHYEGDLTDQRGHVTRVAGGNARISVEEGGVFDIQFITGGVPGHLVLHPAGPKMWEAKPR